MSEAMDQSVTDEASICDVNMAEFTKEKLKEDYQPVIVACNNNRKEKYKKKESTNENVLEVCWAKQNCKCLLGNGSYGNVYKGKWKEKPEAVESIDVAVKAPRNDAQVAYEIKTLKKAKHPNILKFYDKIEYGPIMYAHTEYFINSIIT